MISPWIIVRALSALSLLAALTPVAAQGTEGAPGARDVQGTWKFNAATLLVGVPNVAWERPLSAHRTLQVDLIVSPWRSVDHAPMQFGMLVGEWRHHYRDTEFYQEGFGAIGGATVGYEWRTRRGLVLDLFVGGGTAQSKYKGYSMITGDRYDGEEGWNESGEWLPYRGGLMVTLPRRSAGR